MRIIIGAVLAVLLGAFVTISLPEESKGEGFGLVGLAVFFAITSGGKAGQSADEARLRAFQSSRE